MKVSARNTFAGTVTAITRAPSTQKLPCLLKGVSL